MNGIINGVKKLFGADDTGSTEPTAETSEAPAGGEDPESVEQTGIYKKDIELPATARGKLAFALYNVYSKKECEELIKKTEKRGYEQALINVGFGKQELITDVRNSSRCIWDSEEHAQEMFRRIEPYIPEVFRSRKLVGLNERLRFLRYDPGEYFKPHMDGEYRAPNGDRSQITVHVYLNEGYEGGWTTFKMHFNDAIVPEEDVSFEARTGSVLIFQHDILHEGSLLSGGRKYTVRTDVMYSANTVKK